MIENCRTISVEVWADLRFLKVKSMVAQSHPRKKKRGSVSVKGRIRLFVQIPRFLVKRTRVAVPRRNMVLTRAFGVATV